MLVGADQGACALKVTTKINIANTAKDYTMGTDFAKF